MSRNQSHPNTSDNDFNLSIGSGTEGSFLNSSKEDLMLAAERHEVTLNALHSRQTSLADVGFNHTKSIADEDPERELVRNPFFRLYCKVSHSVSIAYWCS